MKAIEDLKKNFYKQDTTELHWGKIITSAVFVLILLSVGIYNRNRKQNFDEERSVNARYTIGITIKLYNNFRSSQPSVKYFYTVLGKRYSDFESITSDYEKSIVANGGRYYVEFSLKEPSNSRMLFGIPVSDSISSFPDSGWSQIPIPSLDKNKGN